MGEAVTGGAFALLGIEPQLGRAIQPEDDIARGGHPVVMLSHGYWQRAFGGDPQVVGRTLQMGGRGYTIIGVAPADYRGGLPAITPAFYVPMAMLNELMGVEMLDQRDFHSFFVKARLAPGVTRAQAEHAASLVGGVSHRRAAGRVGPGQQFSLVPTSDVQVVPGVDPLLRAAAWLLHRRRGAGAAAGVHESRELSGGARPRSGAGGRRAARPRRDARRARAPGARRERAARARRSGGRSRPGARAPRRSAVGRPAAALRHEARPSLRPRLEGAVRLESAGAHGGRRRVGRGPSRTRPGRSGNARRSRLGAQDGQQRERCARASQVAQRAGRRADRHVARAARGGRAVPEELAADAGRGSGLRPGSDVDPVRHDAGHAVDARRRSVQRTRRLLERFRSAAGRRGRRPRLAAAARVLVQQHRLHRSTVTFRPLAGRRFAPSVR